MSFKAAVIKAEVGGGGGGGGGAGGCGGAWEGERDGRKRREVVGGRATSYDCLLVAERPSNMRVYLRDGSAQIILRPATPR